ncbi:hypothetical protein FE257_003248 [Aspergillus nanangensis]|uniref:Haloacid dehalogenase-like hydrolase n=1 Tax=Aspergillus nanangensis TaxID=2582783 RepID=A0AAD4CU53_ASPNN|nr:hypothetical protein FE257_003248 [Aspergillus nanangensis]
MSARPRTLLLTFDAFGTLFYPRPSVPEQYASAAHHFGIPRSAVTPKKLETAFIPEYKAQAKARPNYGRDAVLRGEYGGPKQWWEEIIRASFARAMTTTTQTTTRLPDALIEHLLDRFASKEGYALYDDVEPFFAFMRALRAKKLEGSTVLGAFGRVVVGVISNSDDRVPAVLRSLGLRVGRCRADEGVDSGLLPGFEHRNDRSPDAPARSDDPDDIDMVITSYEAGEEKPSAHIFEVARRQAQRLLQCEDVSSNSDDGIWTCMHVGDDYEKDYQAAINAGWAGYFIPRDNGDQAPGGARMIQTLIELIPKLELENHR